MTLKRLLIGFHIRVLILIKLKSHGIWANIVKWIQNWLTDRKQNSKVSMGGETSAWTTVHSGVPQGSTGTGTTTLPHLYYDLENGVFSNIVNFSDDTKMCKQVKCHTLQED